MIKHPHIVLKVPVQLSPEQAKAWREIVRSTLPSGLPAEAEITTKGQPKSTDFYARRHGDGWCYIVPLSRNLNIDEVQPVVLAWNKAYPDGDFEIDYSNIGESATVHRDLETVGLKEVAMEAAKINHNQWLSEMTDLGWRYGIAFSQREKRNPAMRPWEDLSPQYRLKELKRFQQLMEVLNRMDLRLVRKRR